MNNGGSVRTSILLLTLLLLGCSDPPPKRALPPVAPDRPATSVTLAKTPPLEAPLTAEAELFWFGVAGAPPPLGKRAAGVAAVDTKRAAKKAKEPLKRYALGPGDVLEFRLPQEAKHDRPEVTVGPDGVITLDLIGPVLASGKTTTELTEELTKKYRKFFRRASPQVSLKKARPEVEASTNEVVVVGPVPKTGRIKLVGQQSLLDVLGGAGYGNKPQHLRDRLTILRQGRSLTILARRVLVPGDPRWNIKLKPNDVVVIHLPDQISVTGEVAKPGAIPLPLSGVLPVTDAITSAGGFTDKADVVRVRITRAWGSRIEQVNLNKVLFQQNKAPAPLRAGDTLSIPAGKSIRVFVFGMVENPGLQRYSGRVSLLQAVSQASPKQFGALLDQAKLIRGWPSAPEVVGLNLENLLAKHDATLNLELHDRDVVYIPESTASDALDVLARVLGPISGPASAAGSILSGVK